MLVEPPMAHWPRSWLVCFTDSEITRNHPIGRWWYRPGFGHCGLLGYMPGSALWSSIDWDHTGLRNIILNKPCFDFVVADLLSKGATFVDFAVSEPKSIWKMPFWPMNCVTLCRHMLAIEKFVVSPYGLYCHLLANGGRRMFVEID